MFIWFLVIFEVFELYRKLRKACRKNFPKASSKSALAALSDTELSPKRFGNIGIGLNTSYSNILDRIETFNLDNPHIASGIILASNAEYKNLVNLLELYEENKN